jgi:hypothetical protein
LSWIARPKDQDTEALHVDEPFARSSHAIGVAPPARMHCMSSAPAQMQLVFLLGNMMSADPGGGFGFSYGQDDMAEKWFATTS